MQITTELKIDFMECVRVAVKDAAVSFGLSQIGSDFADSVADRIAIEHGGCYVRVPLHGGRAKTVERHEKIKREFNGRNLKELAEKYSRTPRQIRRIVQARK